MEYPWEITWSKWTSVSARGLATPRWLSWEGNHAENWWEQETRTLELFIRIASQSEGEGAYELFKSDFAVVVSVKDAEEVFHELARVTIGEELLVEAPELLPVESAVRIVSQELVVPVCTRVLANRDRERDV